MCRWVAYAGQEVYLENLLFLQKNSLISQSLKATKSTFVTNGDGFGVAWYGDRETPGHESAQHVLLCAMSAMNRTVSRV